MARARKRGIDSADASRKRADCLADTPAPRMVVAAGRGERGRGVGTLAGGSIRRRAPLAHYPGHLPATARLRPPHALAPASGRPAARLAPRRHLPGHRRVPAGGAHGVHRAASLYAKANRRPCARDDQHPPRDGSAAPVAAVIRRIDPDIVCLQEAGAHVARRCLDCGHCCPAGRSCAMEAAIFPYPVLSYHGQSVPEWRRAHVSDCPSLAERSAALLVNTHLSTAAHPRSLARGFRCALGYGRPPTRSLGRQRCWRLLAGAAPVVIAGDLNATAWAPLPAGDHRTPRLFAAGLGLGAPSGAPAAVADRLPAGNAGPHAHRCFVPRLRASDHRPVVAGSTCD